MEKIIKQWEFRLENLADTFLECLDTDNRRIINKHEKNPFVFDTEGETSILNLELPTKIKKRIVGSSDLMVTNVTTGEIEGGNFLWQQTKVDSEQFRKIYIDKMQMLYDLKKTGLIVLHFVLSKMITNEDMIYLHIPELMKFGKWKSKKSCYQGIKELTESKLIAPCFMNGWWFINPHVIFNGSRLTLITDYVKQDKKENENNVLALGKGE